MGNDLDKTKPLCFFVQGDGSFQIAQIFNNDTGVWMSGNATQVAVGKYKMVEAAVSPTRQAATLICEIWNLTIERNLNAATPTPGGE